MKARFPASISVGSGLFMAQIIATVQVFISNLALHEKMFWVAQAGYLTVPNQKIIPTLKMVTPAFNGGLFFTLTIGVGISLVSLACAWAWKYPCRLNKGFLFVFFGLWAASIAAINRHGFVLMPTLHAILIPAVVVTLYLVLSPNDLGRGSRLTLLLHFLAISLLAILWSTQMNASLYSNIRDNLLLSNAPGIHFNDFYYHYTLYPAETFRNLNQKLIKTYHLSKTEDARDHKKLKRKLGSYDYLPISEKGKADIEIAVEKERMIEGKATLTMLLSIVDRKTPAVTRIKTGHLYVVVIVDCFSDSVICSRGLTIRAGVNSSAVRRVMRAAEQ